MEQGKAIEVRGLRKRYRLGVIGGATLSDELKVFTARLLGRENPLAKVGEGIDHQREGSHFWALQGIDMDVRQGEIVGIIGRNGAGKSTLLKLLSRITAPTEGEIRMKGRVSSLLEVGTGFNPELTGRENIYLNGAILGLRRSEIDDRLQDIIEFSGIRHHIDTPTKRYSSGMKVRLGFAVAAHLEPEIMIIDEVLAVGDARFQRKCLGKMKAVASGGRTVLFVSHNMASVRSLCERVIWLDEGRVRMEGPTEEVVRAYLADSMSVASAVEWEIGQGPGDDRVQLRSVRVSPTSGAPVISRGDGVVIALEVEAIDSSENDFNIGFHLLSNDESVLFVSTLRSAITQDFHLQEGITRFHAMIPGNLLNEGDYRISVNLFKNGQVLVQVPSVVAFTVHPMALGQRYFKRLPGYFRPNIDWSID